MTELPLHGKLVYTNEEGQTVELGLFNQYSPHGVALPLSQYVSATVSFSTEYSDLGGLWGESQIIGPPDAGEKYGDSPKAYSPSTRNGGSVNNNVNNVAKQEDYWNPGECTSVEGAKRV